MKRFKKDIGMTVNEYIRSMITKKALRQLLFTDQNIKEIAYELKFTNEFYFRVISRDKEFLKI